jgi:hypothetical protein
MRSGWVSLVAMYAAVPGAEVAGGARGLPSEFDGCPEAEDYEEENREVDDYCDGTVLNEEILNCFLHPENYRFNASLICSR